MFKPYFRPGAGSVIYNETGEVLIFERADQPGTWQLPQGGMDAGEEPLETLWRELKEETGFSQTDIAKVTEYPHWTIYAYPAKIRTLVRPDCLGQAHRWYFLELKPGIEVDLTKAHDKEFTDWRWTSFTQLITETGELKKEIYIQLASYFTENIKPD